MLSWLVANWVPGNKPPKTRRRPGLSACRIRNSDLVAYIGVATV